jgi:sugar/nucleoside kinase (ribokinase family)
MFEAVRSVAGERLQWVVVTRHGDGADAYAASSELHVDAPAADQIDATGAGDALSVGLLHSLLQGDAMVTAMRAGAARGAATVTQLRSIPVPWEELAGRSTSQARSVPVAVRSRPVPGGGRGGHLASKLMDIDKCLSLLHT